MPKAVLTVAEGEQILSHPEIDEPLGIRDRAILEMFYATGMRRLELANLKRCDLDTERFGRRTPG